MNKALRNATKEDLAVCTEIRGKTRDNPISVEQLHAMGITPESWAKLMNQGIIIGKVFEVDHEVVAYCYANTETREILVLAVLAEYDNQGIGKALLNNMVRKMKDRGHNTLWLAASPNPSHRAYGFYRYLGWKPTGKFDENGDEILEITP